MMRNMAEVPFPIWAQAFTAARHVARRLTQFNPRSRARRNVRHHYDIDPRIYDLFLDPDRQYSCAYFTRGADLSRSQLAKKRHIAAKLNVEPGLRVLDIGSGWGGLAVYMAKTAGVDVVGVTLSQEQIKASRERAARLGLVNAVRFLPIDYREVEGKFDRIVSVGMFEHVGLPHYYYELNAALTRALERADAESAWLGGEDVFFDVRRDPHDVSTDTVSRQLYKFAFA
jgi:cyclopropane-fatty-acyl-phospholipid synthase